MRFRSGSIGLVLAFGGLSMAGPLMFTVTPVPLPVGFALGGAGSINNLGQVAGYALGPGNTNVPFIASGATSTAVPIPTGFSGGEPFSSTIPGRSLEVLISI